MRSVHRVWSRLGPADRVTLVRAVLIGVVAVLLATSSPRWIAVCVTVVALVLDNVDGRVARRTGTCSDFGARFDMECDAFLILVLSCAAVPIVGWWVLLIGAARYAFWLAGRLLPWLARPVPYRYWRKVVAAVQGIVLTVIVSDVLPVGVARLLAAVAVALLTESFGRDAVWLWRHRVTTAVDLPVGQAA